MPSRSVRSVALGGLSFGVALGLAAAASFGEGCVTSSNPASADDAGGFDGGGPLDVDGAAHEDGSTTDAAPVGNTDASDGAAPACTKHLGPGFTQVLTSSAIVTALTGNGTGRVQAMLLDENDDPMFAYSAYDSSTSWSVDFVRWDACAGQFTTPIQIDTLHPFSASTDVAIAYDPTTHEIAIAYEKGETDNDWADDYTETWLATMTAPETTFTTQPLSSGSTDFGSTASPTIAMANGNLYLAFTQGPYEAIANGNFPSVVWFLSSTATPTAQPSGPPLSDGGAAPPIDAGAGPAPPHYFTYQAVPFTSADVSADNHLLVGYVDPETGSSDLSLALDSSGAPALAAFETADSTGNQQLLYWRPSTASAVSIYSFNLDGNPDVTLSFEGTKPRIAGHTDTPVEADASAVVPDSLAFFASNDGVTWTSAVHLPSNDDSQMTAFTSSLALDKAGHAAVVSDINSSNGSGCGDNPYVATSSDDDGGPWTACGADTTLVHAYYADSVSAAYGMTRANGTLMVSFVSSASNPNDAGAAGAGIIYWQHP